MSTIKTKFNPSSEILIEVTGRGGKMVNRPIALIQAALELAGFDVEVVNKRNTPDDVDFCDKEVYKMQISEGLSDEPKCSMKIKLAADHLVWGG